MNKTSKQIIVMRKTFIINGEKKKLRTGKYAAQCAHASLKAILDLMTDHANFKYIASQGKDGTKTYNLHVDANTALQDWIEGSFTKICCCVETEEELLNVYNLAKEKGLIVSLIKDKGLTEFNGVETITCCAIGPCWSDELVGITDKLELF